MINILIKAIRESLLLIIKRIDNGDCNITDNEAEELISIINKYTNKDERLSKYQCCEYLHISRATFDNYVAYGWIPKGKHQQGFKELYWLKKDLDDFKENKKFLLKRLSN
jgi:hypothetical protein